MTTNANFDLTALMREAASRPEDPRGTWGFRQLPAETVPGWGPEIPTLQREAWIAEGLRLFGSDKRSWAFRCPACGQVQTVADFLKHGVDPQGKVFMACLGRFIAPVAAPGRKPCSYTLGGLVRFPRLLVSYEGRRIPVFEFAEPAPQIHFKVR